MGPYEHKNWTGVRDDFFLCLVFLRKNISPDFRFQKIKDNQECSFNSIGY